MKNFLIIVTIISFSLLNLNASVDKKSCQNKGDDFIFAGGECIKFYEASGESEGAINIIVHGTWDKGTNTLGRYAPFADNIAMATDFNTIAIALPGYSGSTTNNVKELSVGSNTVYSKKYIKFMAELIKELKAKYNVQKVNYMGHSAGATLGANIISLNKGLIDTLTAVGGRYNLDKFKDKKGLVSISENLDHVKDVQILLVYGTADKISKPEVTTSFYDLAKKNKLNVKIVKVVDAAHIDLDMTDESVEAFTQMVAPE